MNTVVAAHREENEEIDKMNAVRNVTPVLPRPLEPAESRLQHLEPAKLLADNRIAHP